jgi:hypothetical protein
LLLLALPGTGTGHSSAIPPGQAFRHSGGRPGPARFSSPLELKKRGSARCPRVAALVQLHPPKPSPRPAGGSHCLGYHLGRAGGWQGPPEWPIARARQPFRATHYALRNPGPGGHRGGGKSADPVFFLRKPIGTYLGALKPACGHPPSPGPISNTLASAVYVWPLHSPRARRSRWGVPAALPQPGMRGRGRWGGRQRACAPY